MRVTHCANENSEHEPPQNGKPQQRGRCRGFVFLALVVWPGSLPQATCGVRQHRVDLAGIGGQVRLRDRLVGIVTRNVG